MFSTFIKLPFVFKSFVLSIFEWPHRDRFYSNYYISIVIRKDTTSVISFNPSCTNLNSSF